MKVHLFIFFTFLLFGASYELKQKFQYDGYRVYRIIPSSKESLQVLGLLAKEKHHLDFWMGPSKIGNPVDIMIPPHLRDEFEEFVNQNKLQSEVFIPNVQERINEEKCNHGNRDGFGWKDYHTLEEIYAWFDELSEKYSEVQIIDAGISYEGRHLMGVHISKSENNSENAIFIEANIHGNEWIGSAVATFIINELLTSNDEGVKWLAESYDWYIVPVTNPDGFTYSHTTDRMWRKTRTPHGSCFGTDPNRNWNSHWGEVGSSHNPCSDNYAGPYVFSENCTRSLAEYISSIGSKLVGYIDFHSYAQLILIPYGWTSAHLDNFNLTYRLGLLGAESLAKRYGTQYQVGDIYETIYPASGSSMDWVKQSFGVPVAFAFELRDTGKYGFLLPPDQIIPTSQETLDALIRIFQEYENSK